MKVLASCWLKTMLLRFLGYGVLIAVFAALIHVYVVYPLYVKKLPYFANAFRAGFDVECRAAVPTGLDDLLRQISLPFFSLDGQLVFIDSKGHVGRCGVNTGVAPNAEIFRFASMTKVLTGVAMLEVAESLSISLNTPVVSYFPELSLEKVQDERVLRITLRHLLNHSSGLGGPFGSDNMIKQGESPWCPDNLAAMETIRLAGEPGTNHLYSNVAYCLLGEVISRVSGVEYQKYIEQNYLSQYPSLQFIQGEFLPTEPAYDFSNDYRFDESYVSWLDFHAIAPAAGLMGKPEEFARLVWHLYRDNPDVLNAANLQQCREKGLDRCYSNTFVIHEGDNGIKVGVQQGYLPGASSLVAISSRGEVLVWTAPGAPLEAKYRDRMAGEVVKLLLNQHE
ncbi:beta-lactamase [Marinimicrobium koreense]|uniref:Beta-lactamase n=1 Tax=Marinimicrobium koreense TaxID=306545 RepID=A0A3N1NM50_9GAMM|nr:serine hydrolase domain-containing protein [Marinimicrobium koreense]ROQ20864.1 beta-lactamase [Marinimicrobium koreense]